MQFIHCADIHLDSPLTGLRRYENLPFEELYRATRQAFENLIELALDKQVDFVVIAGDLFDGKWPDFNTGLFFIRQMERLKAAGIKAFVVRGNHDAESKITAQLRWPDNVHVFSAKAPQTHIDKDLGMAVHGWSFKQAAVTDNMAADYPSRVEGLFNLGVLHTSLTGREGHAGYAPCQVDTLLSKGYDYWALGHVHTREILHKDPWIVFPGNCQGRHIREIGPKGCELVTVQDGRVRLEHCPVDVLRWFFLDIDAGGIATLEALYDLVSENFREAAAGAEGRAVAVRVKISGRCLAHKAIATQPETVREQVRALSLDSSLGEVWVEKIKFNTSPEIDWDALLSREDPVGELVRLIRAEQSESPDKYAELWKSLKRKLPPELAEGADPVIPDDADYLGSMLKNVEKNLVPLLLDSSSA